ncbi:MAG: hypothetical protein K6B64_04995, partial [Acholeplasmatales bacterium]|nr:hypothetical protein [Acholeplasmatales bacterium]
NCINSVFKMASNYVITDGNGNYIQRSGNTIINTDDPADATVWVFSTNGANVSGTISDITNLNMKLNIDGTSLVAGSTNTSWNYDGSNIFNGSNVIKFDGSNWVVDTQNTYQIYYNGHYLRYNNGLVDTSTQSQGTMWTLSNTLLNVNGTGTISANGRYLRYYNGLTTTNQQNQATTWSHDNYGIYYTSGGTKMYIQYISGTGWVAQAMVQKPSHQYYISYGSNYLSISNGSVVRQTTQSSATIWTFSDISNSNYPSGYISAMSGNTEYYLQGQTASGNYIYRLVLSTSAGHYFENQNGYLFDSDVNSYIIYYSNNGTYWWSYAGQYNTLTFTNITDDSPENTPFGSFGVYTNYTSRANNVAINMNTTSGSVYDLACTKEVKASEFSYIPLNTLYDNNNVTFNVDNSNTGYIVGGGRETSGQKADYRVSQYAISNISSSYASGSWKSNAILTIGDSGYGTNKYIGSNSYLESNFSKYTSSKSQLLTTLSGNSSYVYGMHFMDSTININNLVVAPKVKINGQEYTDYEMPEDCIDFKVDSKGFINFFAGCYYPDNDCFFSLHQIIRDSNNKIIDIKHISKIYSANSTYGNGWKAADNIYQYADGTWSGANVSSNSMYTKTFDKAWIETPEEISGNGGDLSDNFGTYLFYFEIPVNKGEYALGSVENNTSSGGSTTGTGAYLIYLDIGANAASVDRTEITQQTTTTKEGLVYVNGIQILATGSSYSGDADSAVAIITKANATAVGINNDIDITRNSDTITFSNSLNLDSTYKGDSITLSGATLVPVSTQTTYSKVLRYVDYNRSTDKLYYTTIYNNGSANTGYDCYSVDKNTGVKTQITDTSDQAEWGLLKIVNGSGTHTTDVTDSAFAFTTSTTTTILDYYTYIDTSALATLTQTIEMSVSEDTVSTKPTDGDYVFEHIYELVGDAITMAPSGLVVYIGPTVKAQASISGPTNNVVTVTVGNYTFTFNANAGNDTNKTVTIYITS